MELHALRTRGWSISAIARHLGRDRKTIRDDLAGKRELGVRRRPGPDVFEQYQAYVQVRLTDDPHVWATALYDEVRKLGYDLSYPSFVREIRSRRLRPHCEACAGVSGRPTIEIDHPLGEEIQWDWLKLPAPWGGDAHLLNGTLAHSTKARGVFAESEDQAHLVEAIDAVVRRLGGNARCWRFDRMGTVVDIGTDHVLPSFAAVAKYYGVSLAICPSRHGNRKGMVEKQNHYSTQRWWRCRGGGQNQIRIPMTASGAVIGEGTACAAAAARTQGRAEGDGGPLRRPGPNVPRPTIARRIPTGK